MKTLERRWLAWVGMAKVTFRRAFEPQETSGADCLGNAFYFLAAVLVALPTLAAVMVFGARD